VLCEEPQSGPEGTVADHPERLGRRGGTTAPINVQTTFPPCTGPNTRT
jgi:hypothetical protein